MLIDSTGFATGFATESKVFALMEELCIYTRETTDVGRFYIGHNVNGSRGCSGGIVVLLPSDYQPSSVHTCDYGKTIAVHAVGKLPTHEYMNVAMSTLASQTPLSLVLYSESCGNRVGWMESRFIVVMKVLPRILRTYLPPPPSR